MKVLFKLAARYVIKEKSKSVSVFIGIFLSAFLVTAVILLGESLLYTLRNDLTMRYGEWHIRLCEAEENEQKRIAESSEVREYSTKTRLGFVEYKEYNIESYLCVYAVSGNWSKMMHCNLISGRFAKAQGEIVVSKSLSQAYPDMYSLDSEGVMDLGCRYAADGEILTEYVSRIDDEIFDAIKSVPYKVVGIYDDENKGRGGIFGEIYTCEDDTVTEYTNIYAVLANPKKVFKFGELFSSESVVYNLQYLSGLGISEMQENSRDSIIFLCGIMIILIGGIAVLLIFNAFQASFSERVREFGLLVTLGSSTAQVRVVMLCEALIIATAAMPVGMAAGVLAVYSSISKVGSMLAELAYVKMKFVLHFHPMVFVLVTVISLIIVIVSTLIPLKSAKKLSPLSAIRQSYIVDFNKKVRAKRYKNRFPVEKVVVQRNVMYYRKKYIAAIISVSMTIIMLLSSISLLKYSLATLNESRTEIPFDIVVHISDVQMDEYSKWYGQYIDGNDKINNDYGYAMSHLLELDGDVPANQGKLQSLVDEGKVYAECYVIDDDEYDKIVSKCISGAGNTQAIMSGYTREYILQGKDISVVYEPVFSETLKGKYKFVGIDNPMECLCVSGDIISEELKFFSENNELSVFFPARQAKKMNMEELSYSLYITADDYNGVAKQLENSYANLSVHNVAADYQSQQNSLFAIEFFLKVFVILIGVVSAINVYFTIMTNIISRKKEFVILKSLGADSKKLRRLLFIECCKFLKLIFLIGYGVSLVITYIMYLGAEHVKFVFPMREALICAVLVIMLYGLTYIVAYGKINNALIVDEIKC